jgi:predicted DNA-binding antitoxin AbrB/MazE fold protein
MFPLKLDEEEKVAVNVRMPKEIRDKVRTIAKEESNRLNKRVSESEIYRRIVSDFFSQHRL